MNKEKKFDCVKFKDELFAKSWKKSGAMNFRDYVEYVNNISLQSSLYKTIKYYLEFRKKNRIFVIFKIKEE